MAKSKRALDLVRPHLLELQPYESVVPPDVLAARAGIPESDVVKLDANENPYGPSPKVAEALADMHQFHLYPDPAQTAMRGAISTYVGLAPEHIVVGNGSDEIIDLAFRAVLSPGDAIVNSTPTFGMYDFTAHVCGGRTVEVERDDEFRIDLPGIISAARQGAKIIVLASPNNPSGNGVPPWAVEQLLATGCLVIIDEAYAEFGGTSAVSLVPQHHNLVVLRTLSKWAGLAGLRVGYGLMDPELADLLMRAKPPYNVNQAAALALIASLSDAATLNARARLIIEERGRMFELLAQLPSVAPMPSDANFILCRVPDGRGHDVYESLARRGVFVRYYSRPKLADYLRVSVGTPEQTDKLIAAFTEALR
ncbi:MAG: histidinol-phosphate transaminase [Dehalococcoidia bacterium]